MRKACLSLCLISIASFVLALPVFAQDETPSLGDVARKSRLEKQKNAQKDAQATTDAPSNPPTPGKDAQKADTTPQLPAAKTAPSVKPVKKVITNEEIPEHVGPTRTQPTAVQPGDDDQTPEGPEGAAPADYWRTRIVSQKNIIASVKNDIESLNASIRYAGANCVSGCAEWNQRQQQKQQQVESMKSQLEQLQTQLEDMQEMARKQGYGSSVYDP